MHYHYNSHKTLGEIKEERLRKAREKIGLCPNICDFKSEKKLPSISYVQSPKVITQNEYLQERKKNNVISFQSLLD